MTTFDFAEVRRFADELEARRVRCDHVEGTACANLDGMLANYAKLCCDYCEQVRQWGRAVFYGRAAFDPQAEALLHRAGRELRARASGLWAYGQDMEGACFALENGKALGAALWQLDRLLTPWVTPQRAVSPLARHDGVPTTDAGDIGEAMRRIAELPALPADWQPTDQGQRAIFAKLKSGRRP